VGLEFSQPPPKATKGGLASQTWILSQLLVPKLSKLIADIRHTSVVT
jgi:hypothetical protein